MLSVATILLAGGSGGEYGGAIAGASHSLLSGFSVLFSAVLAAIGELGGTIAG
jgi:hypothetical protein